mmetsp:Transcript_61908/g.180933  ORF Transcript_61908/g.180933 Transcript_61908/m.180933 type:complete len:486 (+) Transcript_61908:51-1508(+)
MASPVAIAAAAASSSSGLLAGNGIEARPSELHRGILAAFSATPFDPSMLGGLGGFHVDLAQAQSAVTHLHTALRLQPADANASAALGAVLGVFGGDAERADRFLRLALRLRPRHYLARLARALLRGDAELLREATRQHPWRAEAWLALGRHLRGAAASKEEASRALHRAIALQPALRHVVGPAGEGLRMLGEEAAAARAFAAAVAGGAWRSPLQRPRSFFWPGLDSAPLPGESLEVSWPWCRRARLEAEAAVQAVAAEFERARPFHEPDNSDAVSAVSYWVQKCDEQGSCHYRFAATDPPSSAWGKWAEYTVWDPKKHEEEVCFWDVFPRACNLMVRLRKSGVPLSRVGITEVHPPRTRIARHHSPQQGRLRLLCPLLAAEGSLSRLRFPGAAELAYGAEDKGRCWWFDESFEHELLYEGDAPRSSLILDAPHPALVESSPPLEPELGPPDTDERWMLLWPVLAQMAEELGIRPQRRRGHGGPLA